MSLAWEGGAGYWPLRHGGGGNLEDPKQFLDWLKTQAARDDLEWVAHFSNYELGWLATEDVHFRGLMRDSWVAAVLLDETRKSYSLGTLAQEELGVSKDEKWLEVAAKALGIKKKQIKEHLWQLPAAYVGDYGTTDAVLSRRLLLERYQRVIDDQGLQQCFDRETRLTPVLVRARDRGVPVDVDGAQAALRKLNGIVANCKAEIKRLTGFDVDPWNANSLKPALEQTGLVVGTTSTGLPSVTKEYLDAQEGEVPKLIRSMRAHDKQTQFVQAALDCMVNGRVHPTVNQLINRDDDGDQQGAITTRFSYENPNLQQLPARDEEAAKLCRGVYLPYPGGKWCALDYSQQEPRLMVHFGAAINARGADVFVQKYLNDPATDFYDTTLEVLHWAREKRKTAKAIGLGIPYGMGGGKLCRSIGYPTKWMAKRDGKWIDLEKIPVEERKGLRTMEFAGPEGQAVLDQFDEALPFIRDTANKVKGAAERRGWIRTLGGGLARFPMGNNGERWWTHKSFNRLIQRSAAEQTKEAMVQIDAAGGDAGDILVQVHDELGVSCAEPAQLRRAMAIMVEALPLCVPSKVDAEVGPTWGLATGEGGAAWLGLN